MAVIGGSIKSIALGESFTKFEVTADAEVQRKLGGFENTVESFGSGGARIIKTVVPLSLDGIVVGIDDDAGDQEFLQAFANNPEFQPIVITLASGKSWQGVATITDELQFNTMQGTATFSLKGPGNLTLQV
jgi:hypothetical protein